jgi:hypothetical protein
VAQGSDNDAGGTQQYLPPGPGRAESEVGKTKVSQSGGADTGGEEEHLCFGAVGRHILRSEMPAAQDLERTRGLLGATLPGLPTDQRPRRASILFSCSENEFSALLGTVSLSLLSPLSIGGKNTLD